MSKYFEANGVVAHLYGIKFEEPQPRFNRIDNVDERDIVGTDRTVVTRLGFGSPELSFTVWMYPSEWAKLNAMRGEPVKFDDNYYDVTVRSLAQYDVRFYEIELRLKQITI